MKKELAQISIIPIIFIAYGLYLISLKQFGPDLAGIIIIFTGISGFIIGFLMHLLTQKYSDKWYYNIIKGLIGCILVYVLVIIYARIS